MTDASLDAGLEFFAACPRHVADLLASELRDRGINVTREHPAGVSFMGPIAHGYVACLHARTASRVLLTLATVPLDSPETMYEALRNLPWEEHLAADGTLAVDVVGEAPAWLRHSQFAAQKAKDAIVDRFRARTGGRPSVDLGTPDLRVSLRLARSHATVGIDLSGEQPAARSAEMNARASPMLSTYSRMPWV